MDLERERKKLEVSKMAMAVQELEFKILERQQDIARIKENIKKCEERAIELKGELKE